MSPGGNSDWLLLLCWFWFSIQSTALTSVYFCSLYYNAAHVTRVIFPLRTTVSPSGCWSIRPSGGQADKPRYAGRLMMMQRLWSTPQPQYHTQTRPSFFLILKINITGWKWNWKLITAINSVTSGGRYPSESSTQSQVARVTERIQKAKDDKWHNMICT